MKTNGRIGLGTSTPSQKLSVAGNVEIGVGATVSSINLRSTAGSSRFGNDSIGLFAAADVAGTRIRFNTNPGAGNLERLSILANGNVGIQKSNPSAKLQVVNATCNGEQWLDTSSRTLKRDIRPLSSEEASQALRSLSAVKFAYNSDPDEECVGFIAEDVPDLVARNDRRTLHAMDLVGVLAKVVQDQERELKAERETNAAQQKLLAELNERLLQLEAK